MAAIMITNELSPAASCGVSGRYDIDNLIEASFWELDPKRLKINKAHSNMSSTF
jgi:hypothetical protein